jgi:hypothetical protein
LDQERAPRTHTRPYTSDKGAANNGPMAYDRTKILNVNAKTVESVMPNFIAKSGKPGAIMALAKGVTSVYSET